MRLILQAVSLFAVMLGLQPYIACAGADKLVLADALLKDNRIVKIDGVYPLVSGLGHSCQLSMVQDIYGVVAATLTIDGTGAPAAPFAVSVRLKPAGEGDMFLTAKGNSGDGWKVEITGEYVYSSSAFNVHIVLDGPDGLTEYDKVLALINTNHDFHVYGKHSIDGKDTWYLDLPAGSQIDGVGTVITKVTTPSTLKVKHPGISLSVKCSTDLDPSPVLFPAAGDSGKLKIGKMNFREHQIRWYGITATPE